MYEATSLTTRRGPTTLPGPVDATRADRRAAPTTPTHTGRNLNQGRRTARSRMPARQVVLDQVASTSVSVERKGALGLQRL